MRRFFCTDIDGDAKRAYLDGEESHHLVKVLRLQVGDLIELFDGTGTRYTAEVESLGRRVSVRITNQELIREEPGPSLIVCQGALKGRKMDFLVEKCTELGVDRFIPFAAGRSQGRRDAAHQEKTQRRRRTIVKTACKQCGRLRLMEIDSERDFSDLLQLKSGEENCLRVMLWEKERATKLGDVIARGACETVFLMFGPEGGYSAAEAERARSAGWLPVSLGARILRAETATISAVAITRHLLGSM